MVDGWNSVIDHWVTGFARPMEASPAVSTAFDQAAEVMLSEAVSRVHILSSDLHDSSEGPNTEVFPGRVESTIKFTMPYAKYEFGRGGEHDAITIAFAETRRMFEKAIVAGMEAEMTTWR